MRRIHEKGTLDADLMAVLESDEWVNRVWTYQELVNNNRIRFVAQDQGTVWADAEQVLNRVANSIGDFQENQGLDSFEFRASFPRLDALQELIVDWKIAGYLERTAYQVLSGMHGRQCQRPDDRYLAMLGTISDSIDSREPSDDLPPAEKFLSLCESKADYSFIYTTAGRNAASGQRWRPLATEPLRAIFPWHSWGDGQSGTRCDTHLELNGMWIVQSGTMSESAWEFVDRWTKGVADKTGGDRATAMLSRLQLAGFDGCHEPVETEHGYLYPQRPIGNRNVYGAVATGIRTTLGSPALVLAAGCEDVDVAWFAGIVPKSGKTVSVG